MGVADLGRLPPSFQPHPRNVQLQLAPLVIVPEMPTQLDVRKRVNAVVEESRDAERFCSF